MGRVLSVLIAALVLAAVPAEARVTRYLTGNAADVQPALHGPAHDFGGGGTDVDPAIQWMIDRVRGCTSCSTRVDVVVLRAAGADGYNEAIFSLNGVDSVETLVVTQLRDANRSDIEATIRNAEVVFFAGGNQCDYVRLFKGTRVETAVQAVYARGGGVGGTSAGWAIQGDFVYDACRGSVLSSEALADPYHRYVTFTHDLFAWRHLGRTIADSHFVARDRMGRTMAFIARQIQDGKASSVLGIGVDEQTSVVVDEAGLARVMGRGPAYFVLGDHPPEVCRPGAPLTFSNFKVWKVPAGGSFDLHTRPTTGFTTLSVTRGVIASYPY